MKVTGIILVAGDSTRFGTGMNKNLAEVEGRSILSYSLRTFLEHPKIDEVMIVCRRQDLDSIQMIVLEEDCSKPIHLVYGGRTRKESVHHALIESDADIVAIHDGARPAVKSSIISQCLQYMNEYPGVIVGVKAKDTIKIVNEREEIISSTNRDVTWNAQTPQCFQRSLLLRLHEKYQDEFITDDAMLLEKDGYPVKMVEGDYSNIKVTTYDDFLSIKKYLKEKE